MVTGAGFTHALVPGAPLLVDDFNNDVLEDKVRKLPNASRLLDWERSLDEGGRIDIERLMTRLDALMPYDYAENAGNAANEYGFLLSELKRAFLDRLHEARKGDIHHEELRRFAAYCKTNGCCCITFNYDDFLDQSPVRIETTTSNAPVALDLPGYRERVAVHARDLRRHLRRLRRQRNRARPSLRIAKPWKAEIVSINQHVN